METVPISGTSESSTVGGTDAQFNWFPINIYDAREGEVRDWATALRRRRQLLRQRRDECRRARVGNLRKWLKGTIGATGSQVDYVSQNGYILYFSDRRGMLPDPLAAPFRHHRASTASRT